MLAGLSTRQKTPLKSGGVFLLPGYSPPLFPRLIWRQPSIFSLIQPSNSLVAVLLILRADRPPFPEMHEHLERPSVKRVAALRRHDSAILGYHRTLSNSSTGSRPASACRCYTACIPRELHMRRSQGLGPRPDRVCTLPPLAGRHDWNMISDRG